MVDRDVRPPAAMARSNAMILGCHVYALRPAGDVGDLGQCAPQPGIAAVCPRTETELKQNLG